MNKQIFKTTSILAFFTLIARVLGLIRDQVTTEKFGATATVDAFFTANKVLSSFRGFVENPLSQIFVPALSQYRKKHTREEEKNFIATTAGTVCFFVFCLVCIGIVLVPYLMKLSAPGLEPYRFNLAVHFLRLTFPYLLFISFCGLGVAIMNVYDQPLSMAVTPIWLSISYISAAKFLSSYFEIPVTALAWGVLLGGILQIIFVITVLKRLDLLFVPKIDFYNPDVRRVMRLALPAALSASAPQISLLVNTNLASYLPVGAITWIYCADRLIYFPLSIIGISLSNALLKPLSKYHAEKDEKSFNETLGWGLRSNLLVAIPASITIGMLAGPFIVTVFMKGQFTLNDVAQTQKALLGYIGGISAFMLMKLLVSAFYTRQDTSTPVKVITIGAITNIAIGMMLIPRLQQAGITLANSANAWVQVLLMLVWLRIPLHNLFSPPQGLTRWLFSIMTMTVTLSAFLYIFNPPLATWLAWDKMQRYLTLGALGLGAVIIVWIAAIYSGDFKQPIETRPKLVA